MMQGLPKPLTGQGEQGGGAIREGLAEEDALRRQLKGEQLQQRCYLGQE